MVTQFTPLASTFGGALIGAAAVIWMLFNGRISGISGILGSLLPPYANASFAEAAAFILGLVAAPLLWMVLTARPIQQSVSTNVILMATAGLLVGVGAMYGYGCTSGHGVCGLARLSYRSLVATLIFMATGVATVFVTRHVIGG